MVERRVCHPSPCPRSCPAVRPRRRRVPAAAPASSPCPRPAGPLASTGRVPARAAPATGRRTRLAGARCTRSPTSPAAGSPARAGLQALREKTLDVDLLMIVAALGAAAIGQVMDGALLIVIFATSGALEALATARTADSVRGLLDLAPATATRLHATTARRPVAAAELARRRHHAGPPRRAHRRRRPGAGRGERGRPGDHHRRTAAGRQGARATRSSPAPSTAPARCGCGSSATPPTR